MVGTQVTQLLAAAQASALNQWAYKNPLTAAVLAGGLKNGASDAAVQLSTSSSSGSFDWRRSAVFTTFGLFYSGAGQYMVFNRIFPMLLPGGKSFAKSRAGVLGAVLLDNFIHMPFVYLPIFYCMRELAHTDDIQRAIHAGRTPPRPHHHMYHLPHPR